MAELNIDTFGEVIDNFLKINKIQLLVEMEEGTRQPTIKDNTNMGSVIQFYILMHAMSACMENMMSDMGIDASEKAGLIDDILKILKADILSEGNDND